MKGTVPKVAITMLAVLALTLVGVGLFIWAGNLSVARAESIQAPPVQKPDNSQCLGCHGKPDQIKKFPNGDTVSITVDEQVYDHAAHANLACQVCHANITGDFPHPANPAGSSREYTR
jgi:cytochrome c553